MLIKTSVSRDFSKLYALFCILTVIFPFSFLLQNNFTDPACGFFFSSSFCSPLPILFLFFFFFLFFLLFLFLLLVSILLILMLRELSSRACGWIRLQQPHCPWILIDCPFKYYISGLVDRNLHFFSSTQGPKKSELGACPSQGMLSLISSIGIRLIQKL